MVVKWKTKGQGALEVCPKAEQIDLKTYCQEYSRKEDAGNSWFIKRNQQSFCQRSRQSEPVHAGVKSDVGGRTQTWWVSVKYFCKH